MSTEIKIPITPLMSVLISGVIFNGFSLLSHYGKSLRKMSMGFFLMLLIIDSYDRHTCNRMDVMVIGFVVIFRNVKLTVPSPQIIVSIGTHALAFDHR